MAKVSANAQLNMLNPAVWYGDVLYADSGFLVIANDVKAAYYVGTGFTYSNGGISGGTITGYGQESFSSEILDLEVTELSINAVTAASYINSGNLLSLYSLALTGNDSIVGSAAADYLRGFGGNDQIDGSDGVDTVIYSGAKIGYTISASSGGGYL